MPTAKQHQLQPGRGRVHPRHRQGLPHRQAAARRHDVGQQLERLRRYSPFSDYKESGWSREKAFAELSPAPTPQTATAQPSPRQPAQRSCAQTRPDHRASGGDAAQLSASADEGQATVPTAPITLPHADSTLVDQVMNHQSICSADTVTRRGYGRSSAVAPGRAADAAATTPGSPTSTTVAQPNTSPTTTTLTPDAPAGP
jgi:hypothetical protein